jgi:uncharacterized membrane protein YidH (DUF202 family)
MIGISEGIMTESVCKPVRDNLDPVVRHAYREATVVLAVWLVGIGWTVGYCAITGYNVPPEQIRITLGMPNWVFWGILVPWVLVILFTIWFGLFYIADDELAPGQGESYQGSLPQQFPKSETDEISQ